MLPVKVDVISKSEIDLIMEQTYELLEETGVDIKNEEALDLLMHAGCSSSGTVTKIPRQLIKSAIETAPSCIEIFDRNGKSAMKLTGMNSYFGPGPTCPNFFDPQTGERRRAIKQDAADTACLCQALPNIDFVMSLCSIGDVPVNLADVYEMDAMLRNTTKPIVGWSFTGENLQKIIDMCAVVAGSLEALQEKPFVIIYAEPITPFIQPDESLNKLMLLARNKIPVVYSPGMILGATCPTTIAGALSVGLVDALAGLLVSQLVSEGAPFISVSAAGPMDMMHMQHAYGAPEAALMNAAACSIFHDIGIPVFGVAGASDSKAACDGQTAAETMLQILFSISAGGNLTHDIGFMDAGLTGSLSSLVMCDELIGMARRFMRGFRVDDECLAKEVIQEVGIGGNYLAEEHTLEHFRDEFWVPKLFDRRPYEAWENDGGKDLKSRCDDKVREILAKRQVPPLADDVLIKLDSLIEALS